MAKAVDQRILSHGVIAEITPIMNLLYLFVSLFCEALKFDIPQLAYEEI